MFRSQRSVNGAEPTAQAQTGCLGRPAAANRSVITAIAVVIAVLLGVSAKSVVPAAEGELPLVITGGGDHTIKRWDSNGKLVLTIGTHDDSVVSVLVQPGSSGSVLISAGSDGTLRTWSVTEGKSRLATTACKDGVSALAVSSDGSLIATGGSDGHIKLWDGMKAKPLADFPSAHTGSVRALAFTSDGRQLVSGGSDKMIRIWKVNRAAGRVTALEYQTNIVAHDDAVTGLVLSQDDKTIASVSMDGYLKTWNMGGGGLINRLRVGASVQSVAFSQDGRTLATGDDEGKIRLWNAATAASIIFTASHDRAVYALAWTNDSRILVSGSADKTLRYWNVQTGKQLAKVTAHDGAVRSIVILQ